MALHAIVLLSAGPSFSGMYVAMILERQLLRRETQLLQRFWELNCAHACLQEYAKANPSFAHYADFGKGFLSDEPVGGHYDVKEALMPDSLHPSAVGMRIIASQLEPLIASLVRQPVGDAVADADWATSR